MAIYSLNLKSIGRTTHAPGTAGAHLLYIARDGAEPELVSEHMPLDPNDARAWMNRAEMADRKNARVIDKVRLALPRELTPEQRMALVQDFARNLTSNKVAWYAAIHAKGKDAHNPHCHLVIRDRDLETGKRILKLSDSPRDRAKAGLEPKAVDWVRETWEDHANRALEQAGHDVRIDRRTLEAQGIDREPTIHIGPQAAHVDEFVDRPNSKIRETGNGRTIDYPQIDEGRTRKERHAEILDFNLEKAARSPDLRTRETARLQREQMKLDRQLENRLIREARRRTQEMRALRGSYRSELKDVIAAQREDARVMRASLQGDWQEKRAALTERHVSERDTLKADHRRLSARVFRVIDITGRTRAKQNDEKQALKERQALERHDLVQSHRDQKAAMQEALSDRYGGIRRELKASYAPQIDVLKQAHHRAEIDADRERQKRAAERELAEKRAEELLARAEQIKRTMERDRQRTRNRSRER